MIGMRSRSLVRIAAAAALTARATSFGWSGFKESMSLHSLTCSRTEGGSSFPEYGLANVNLSSKWLELVRNDKVSATVSIGNSTDKVRYGVRIAASNDPSIPAACEEFVEQIFDGQERTTVGNPLIERINATLIDMQKQTEAHVAAGVKYKRDGHFASHLQLVRTLRPPSSKGFEGDAITAEMRSTPPPYEQHLDSFLTGTLRLRNRPRAALLNQPPGLATTPWDVYHNVSPADSRGHFLLLPTLDDSKNNRGQRLTSNDCHDLVNIASTVEPAGSLLISFNSVGAGASQNHIHCHAWPSPPIPLLDAESDCDGWNCYAVSKVTETHDEFALQEGAARISFLKYPCFCIKVVSPTNEPQNLDVAGKAVHCILDTIGDAPHNIGMLNLPAGGGVHVYVFIRRAERSMQVAPTLKLGSSEMMGVFHAQTLNEMLKLGSAGNGPRALRDVSYEPQDAMWNKLKARLLKL